MKIQLIEGSFSPNDAAELLSQLIQAKIKFHENKISILDAAEDTKVRENKIKRLQHELSEIRTYLNGNENVQLSAEINLK